MERWRLIREIVLFVGGFAGVFYEGIYQHVERPTVLFVYLSMMGLASFLRANGMRNHK